VAEPMRIAAAAPIGEGPVEVIWRAPKAPARPKPRPRLRTSTPPPAAPPGMPLEPEDIYDEGASRWEGRGFTLVRSLDPSTGLARDQLRVVAGDGMRHEIDLPGEPCGPSGHFGRPQYRIAEDGLHAVDLRFVEGGCHALSIDLESGAFTPLDPTDERAVCRTERRVPPGHLGVALRGYLRLVEEALGEADVDPSRAYVLRIDASGATYAETRDTAGKQRLVRVAPFPVSTPLQIVHVSNVAPLHGVAPSKGVAEAPAGSRKLAPPQQPPAPEPSPEPL